MLNGLFLRTSDFRLLPPAIDLPSTVILGLTAVGLVFMVATLARNPRRVLERQVTEHLNRRLGARPFRR